MKMIPLPDKVTLLVVLALRPVMTCVLLTGSSPTCKKIMATSLQMPSD